MLSISAISSSGVMSPILKPGGERNEPLLPLPVLKSEAEEVAERDSAVSRWTDDDRSSGVRRPVAPEFERGCTAGPPGKRLVLLLTLLL